jgi:hypothetical protein
MWHGTELVAGILLLYFGAEWLVKGAAGLVDGMSGIALGNII